MFRKNSAFTKSAEQQAYEESVRERALHYTDTLRDEDRERLQELVKEAREVIDNVQTSQEDEKARARRDTR